MVHNHMRLGLRPMKCSTNDLMNSDIAGKNHITRFLILYSKSPDIIILTGSASFFREAKDSTIITDQVLTVLVFTGFLLIETIDVYCLHNQCILMAGIQQSSR